MPVATHLIKLSITTKSLSEHFFFFVKIMLSFKYEGFLFRPACQIGLIKGHI